MKEVVLAPASRWPLSDGQVFTVGAMIIFGIFAVTCGAGMSDVAIAGLGIAVGTLGPTLIIMTNIRGGSRDFVFGTAFVREASPLPPVGVAGRCDFELFVNAHGVDGASVRLRDPAVPVNKWPEVGASLPVMVDARDPRHLRILWDEVRTRREIELDRRTAAQHVSDTSAESDTDAADADLFILNDTLLNDTGTDDTGPNDDDAKPPSARPLQTEAPPLQTEAPPSQTEAPWEDPGSCIPELAQHRAAGSPGLGSTDDCPGSTGVSVTLIVSDLDRSRAFYRDKLGLTEIDVGAASAVLAFGEARIALQHVADMPPIDRRPVHLNLDVPDVKDAYDQLVARGVKFVHRPQIIQRGEHLELYSATFRDPDGHALAITRWTVRR